MASPQKPPSSRLASLPEETENAPDVTSSETGSIRRVVTVVEIERGRDSAETLCEKPVTPPSVPRATPTTTPPATVQDVIITMEMDELGTPQPRDTQVTAQPETRSFFSLKNYRPTHAVRELLKRIQGEPSGEQSYAVSFKSVSYENLPTRGGDEVVVWLGGTRSVDRICQEQEHNNTPVTSPDENVGRAREWL